MKILRRLAVFAMVALICQLGAVDVLASTSANLKITSVKATLNKGEFRYPKLEGLKQATIETALNRKIKNDILLLNNDETSSLNGAFTIQYFNGRLLALRFTGDSFTPDTVHPNKLDVVFHYDLNTGKRYQLADLFIDKTKYISQVKEILQKKDKAYRVKSSPLFKEWSYDDFDSAWDRDETYFGITSQSNMNIYFIPSFATGSASGYDLPLSSLKGKLDTKGAFYKAIMGSKPESVKGLNYSKPILLQYP